MKNLFYYKIQPYNSFIRNDKVRVNGEPYEDGYWMQVIGSDIERTYIDAKNKIGSKAAFNLVSAEINQRITVLLEKRKQKSSRVKPFYLNFNADGIDCFVHRWNWE